MTIKIPKLKELVVGQFVVFREESFTKDLASLDIYKIASLDTTSLIIQTCAISFQKQGRVEVTPNTREEVSEVNGKSITKVKVHATEMRKGLTKKHYVLFQDYLDARMKFLEQERERTAKLSELISSEEMKEVI